MEENTCVYVYMYECIYASIYMHVSMMFFLFKEKSNTGKRVEITQNFLKIKKFRNH